MKRYILAMFTIALISMPASAIEDTWGAICVTGDGNQCDGGSDEEADESPIDRDLWIGDPDNYVTHMLDWDGEPGDICRIGWNMTFDPLVMYEFVTRTVPVSGSIGSGVHGVDLEVQCYVTDVVHNKPAPAGYPGNTSRQRCYVQEDDWNTLPEGDMVIDDDLWEASIYWRTQTIQFQTPTSARTGDHAVTLHAVQRWVVDGGVCVKENLTTNPNQDDVVKFTIWEEDSSVPNKGSDCSSDADIDGDDVCDSDDDDNCSGFWGHNPDQTDADGDGYGNVCDGDVNQNCLTEASDYSAIYGAIGDKESSGWDGETPPLTDSYDINVNDEVDADDDDAAFKMHNSGPGPSNDPNVDCEYEE